MGNRHKGFNPSDSLTAAAANEAELIRLTDGLSEAQFHAPSRNGGWSVGFCIEHLVLTGQAFLPLWDRALKEAAREPSAAPACPYPWWNRAQLSVLEPPYTVKTKAIQPFVPSSRRSIEETIRRFANMHRELARRIEVSIGVDAARTKVQSPFVSWMSYPLGFSFDLALTHERRHLWQAWQVRRQFMRQER